jgi:hypothetical protein
MTWREQIHSVSPKRFERPLEQYRASRRPTGGAVVVSSKKRPIDPGLRIFNAHSLVYRMSECKEAPPSQVGA